MSRRQLFLAIGALSAAGCAWFFLWRDRAANEAPAEARPTSVPEQHTVDSVQQDAATEGTESERLAQIDVPIVIRGRVHDTDEDAIVGAAVWCTPLLAEFDVSHWGLQSWSSVESTTLRATTREGGDFDVVLPTDHSSIDNPWVVWIGKPGYASEARVISRRSTSESLSVELTPCSPTVARVVDGEGAVVASALVELMGSVSVEEAVALSPIDARARRLFYWTGRTSAAGELELPAVERWMKVRASRDSKLSRVRTGSLEGRIVLVLSPTFILEGEVVLSPDASIVPDGNVLCGPEDEMKCDWLARVGVRLDGRFGPERVPIVASERFAYQLNGGNLRPIAVHRNPPLEGEIVHLRFEAVTDPPLALRAIDTESHPIEGVAFRLAWSDGVQETALVSPTVLTNADGRARIPMMTQVGVHLLGSKRGWASFTGGPGDVGDPPRDEIVIVMERAGTIEGRVTHAGAPVEAFQVAYWPDLDRFGSEAFRSRDGRFVIEDVPCESHFVYAWSETLPRSEIATVKFEEARASVELDLPSDLRGEGRVIDAVSREPVGDATVELWNSDRAQLLTLQSSTRSEADGSFALAGMRLGRNMLWVKASGYESLLASGFGHSPSATVDFGLVPMTKGADVALRLVSDAKVDFTAFRVSSTGIRRFPISAFPASGELVLGPSVAGGLFFLVDYPDGTSVSWRQFLRSGERWSFDHRVPADAAIALRVRAGPACGALGRVEVVLTYADPSSGWVQRFAGVDVGDVLELANLPRGAIVISAFADGAPVGRQRVELGLRERDEVEFELACRTRVLRVVDARGAPAASAQVSYWCADEEPRAEHTRYSDADGRVELADPGCEELIVNVAGATWHYGMRVRLASDSSRETLVTLEPPQSLRVALRDGDHPLAGVWTWVEEPTSGFSLESAYSNAAGLVAWDGLRPGGYRVIVSGQELWRTEQTLDTGERESDVRVVQVRRTGSVEIRARYAQGVAVGDVEVTLTSEELGQSTDAWLAAGRIESIPQGATTDASGELRLTGLPHGRYAWTATDANAAQVGGSVTVEPRALVALDVRFP